MSRVRDDLSYDVIEPVLQELIDEENIRMQNASRREKMLSYEQIGKELAVRLKRPIPYTAKTICKYMKMIGYKPDRKSKQYIKRKIFVTESYVYPPPLLYVKATQESDIKSIVSFCERELPNIYLDYMRTSNGILLIGQSDKFYSIFAAKYEKVMKESGIRYTKVDTL